MKRQSETDNGTAAVPYQRSRAHHNKEVVAATVVPSMDAAMSSHVRHLCETLPNNGTGLYGKWNKMTIPGTKVANAIGLNPFPGGDPVTLYKILRGYTEAEPMDEKQQKRVAYGIENEARGRALYCSTLGLKPDDVFMHDRTVSFLYPWISYGCDGHARGFANPWDRLGHSRPYLLEIKCPEKPYTDIPLHYMVQIQTGMAVHGMPWCDFIMYHKREAPAPGTLPVEHLKVWRVRFNPECWQRILDRLVYFMNCLHTDTPPETEFMLSTTIDRQYFEPPCITSSVIVDQDVHMPDEAGTGLSV